MKIASFLAAACMAGGVGCASTGGGTQVAERGWSNIASTGDPTVHVGEAHVIDARVNPLVPVGVTADGSALVIRYGSGKSRGVARLDARSLEQLPSAADDTAKAPPASTGAARVLLPSGRFLMIWKRGSAEWGYRAMAQEFGAGGSPYGAPVIISQPDVDVVGSPQAVTTDGQHVVATFAAASDSGFKLVAVPLELDAAGSDGDRVAGR
jgi:hypothetical protein